MKHKNILLLDINDTLDDGRTTEELESWAFDDFFIRGKRHIPGVAIPKEWIERFWDFLREYHDRIIPIFWTAVWVRSQERFVHEVLKAPVYAFSTDFKAGVWELLVPWKPKFYSESVAGGNGGSKSAALPKVFSRFGEWINTIWFEDCRNNSSFSEDNIHGIGIKRFESLVSKIEEIKNLLV